MINWFPSRRCISSPWELSFPISKCMFDHPCDLVMGFKWIYVVWSWIIHFYRVCFHCWVFKRNEGPQLSKVCCCKFKLHRAAFTKSFRENLKYIAIPAVPFCVFLRFRLFRPQLYRAESNQAVKLWILWKQVLPAQRIPCSLQILNPYTPALALQSDSFPCKPLDFWKLWEKNESITSFMCLAWISDHLSCWALSMP